jgi:hypothetical protein
VEWHQNVINGMDKEIGNVKWTRKRKRKMKRNRDEEEMTWNFIRVFAALISDFNCLAKKHKNGGRRISELGAAECLNLERIYI